MDTSLNRPSFNTFRGADFISGAVRNNLLTKNGREWNKERVKKVFRDEIAMLILKTQPLIEPKTDQYSWVGTKTGQFTMKVPIWAMGS